MNVHKHKSQPYNNTNNKGFTIIEVVLVLAIAGLIFLMVFIALPALQRNQRDTQRKNDMSRLKTAIDNYKANNRGQIPTELNNDSQPFSSFSFGVNYLKADQGEFNDPDGEPYLVRYLSSRPVGFVLGVEDSSHFVFITSGKKCNGEVLADGSGPTNYAIQMALEGGGCYCIDG